MSLGFERWHDIPAGQVLGVCWSRVEPGFKLIGHQDPRHALFVFWRVHARHHRVLIRIQGEHGEREQSLLPVASVVSV